MNVFEKVGIVTKFAILNDVLNKMTKENIS
jgi:hypothetical protein